MKIKTGITFFLCIAVVVAFFSGRWTAPDQDDSAHFKAIDSLTKAALISHNLAKISQENAQKAYQRGVQSQKGKVVTRTIYRNDLKANRALNTAQKDSTIKKMFQVENDSSKFTEPVANGILDLRSENKMLRADDLADSITVESFREAITNMDDALTNCYAEGEAKNGIIIEQRGELKDEQFKTKVQKALKWFFAGLSAVLATLIISNSNN